MTCYTQQIALAASITTAIAYSFGALAIFIFPTQTAQALASLFYLTSADLLPHLTISLSTFIKGLLQIFAYTYLYTWLLGVIYSRLVSEE